MHLRRPGTYDDFRFDGIHRIGLAVCGVHRLATQQPRTALPAPFAALALVQLLGCAFAPLFLQRLPAHPVGCQVRYGHFLQGA